MDEETKRRFDALYQLFEGCHIAISERRKYEWRATLSLWGVFIGLVATLLTRPLTIPRTLLLPITIFLLLILVFHWRWLASVGARHDENRETLDFYEEKMHNLLELASFYQSQLGKRKQLRHSILGLDWSRWIQLAVSIILASLAVFVLWLAAPPSQQLAPPSSSGGFSVPITTLPQPHGKQQAIQPLTALMLVKTLISQTFWTAIAAIGTVGALYLIYKQIANARNVAAYEFLRKEDDRFSSKEMRHNRSELAKLLLLRPDQYKEIDKYADHVLGYFEDLGLMLRKHLAPEYFVWTMNSYYVLRYWEVLAKYIDWVRKDRSDPTYYNEFEYLHKMMLKVEKKFTKKPKIEFTPEELRKFLEEESHVDEERGEL